MKLAFFLQTLEAKITTEIQRNVKLLHLLNEKVICLTVREGKKYNFAPKLEAATLAGARVNFTDSAETFLVSKWSRIFQISWTSKIQKIKLQTKELNKMADEELEKSIDDQKSVNTCRSTTPD